MRKKLLIGAASLLGLVLLLLIAAFWYIRSGRLDLLLQNQIIAGLESVGIRAEVGRTHLDLRGYKVTLEDLKLYAGDGTAPFGAIERIEATFSVADYLRRHVNITEVRVTRPEIWVEIDEQGRSNLDALHAPPEREAERVTIAYLTAYVEVQEAKLNFVDRARGLTAMVPGASAKFIPREPAALEDRINHVLEMSFNGARATYQGQPIENIAAQIEADVQNDNAVVRRFDLTSPVANAGVTGRVESYSPVRYDMQVRADAALAEVSRLFAPNVEMSGGAGFNGRVAGTGLEYRASGNVESNGLSVSGFDVAGLRVRTDVTGEGTRYEVSADASTGAVSGQGVSIASVALNDARVTGQAAEFELTSALQVAALRSGRVAVNNLRARLDLDPRRLSLSQLTASALGGGVSGSAVIAYAGGESSVDVQFRSIDLNQAATLAAARNVTVRGTAGGRATLRFPGVNYRAAAGRINATFDAAISPVDTAAEAAPAQGRVSLIATGQGFNVEEAVVRSAQSEVTANGTINWNGGGTLNVNFRSQDMSEVQRVIESFGLIPDEVREEYQVALTGGGEFTGTVTGRLTSPRVAGRLTLENIAVQDDQLGRFEGDIAFADSHVRVDNGALVRDDGSRADFTIDAPLEADNRIAVRADVKDFDLSAVLRAVSPAFSDFVRGGRINGTIDLRGLPGPRTIEGTADIALTGGEFGVPPEDESQPARTVSVPEFNGRVTIANSLLSVEDLRLRVGDATVTGRGSFNLDTYAYDINAEGQQIDLNQIGQAFAENLTVTGTADVKVVGQGKWEDWSDINLNATIQGQDVRVNGRELGDAQLRAYTDNGLLRLEATGAVLNEPRTLAATIDLRDRKNYPVSASIEFTDEDLAPYLALAAPELANITARGTGNIRLSGPLQEPDQIQAVAVLSSLTVGGAIEGQRYLITNQDEIVLTASPREVTLNRVTLTGEGTRITLGGTLSREEPARSNLSINGEVNLRLISSFTRQVFASGLAHVQASIGGTLGEPRLLGSVGLEDVGVRVVDVPLALARGNGTIRFTANQALIENFEASTPGGGQIRVDGGAALEGLVPARFRLEVTADQVGVEYPRDAHTVFDAQLSYAGNPRAQVLTGRIDVRRASYTREVTIEELISGEGPLSSEALNVGPDGGGGGAGVAGSPISLDLRVNADNTLVVRNNLLDALGSMFLTIRGSASSPLISGRVQLTRGTIEFRNGRHEIVRGLVTLPPRRESDPVVDFQTEADIRSYRVYTTFSGPVSNPRVVLRSEPELPEADIISLVLTGSISGDPTARATATQTGLGLAQSILSASLSEQLQRGTQRLFGLSRFSIDPLIVGRSSDPTARVTLGQQITRDLSITYSQNLTSGPGGIDRVVLVEYRLSNRFSIVGFRNERGELGFDVRVRRRF